MVEFAFMLPLLMLMMFAMADLVRFARAHLRVHSAATQIGQIVSQCERRLTPSDGDLLRDLTGRILGSFADNGAQWRLVITAFGRDNTNGTTTNINWDIDRSPVGPATLNVTPRGPVLPPNYTVGRNKLLYRTEVFASVDRTPLTRLVSLLAERMTIGAFETVRADVVHSTRLGNTDTLRNTSSTGCLT